MIPETIIVALITSGFTFAGVLVANKATNRKNAIEQAVRDQKIADELQSLSDRVDVHNGYAEKFSGVTTNIELLQKDIEYMKNSIKELKDIPICKVK